MVDKPFLCNTDSQQAVPAYLEAFIQMINVCVCVCVICFQGEKKSVLIP
jgi:hypothetical protein